MQYRAFFSYSRADDRTANWLHRALDRYRTPKALVGGEGKLGPVPDKLHKIFRDRSDLSSGGHLVEDLQEALEASERLIILCTPNSAKSHWVNREVETFLRLGREDRIFPVIASGEPESGDPATECFPPALQGKGLLGADLREIKLPNGRLVGDGREGGRLKLIAGLLGLPLDMLAQRERRRQRQLVMAFAGAAVLFAVLAGAAAIAANLAIQRLDRSLRAESRELVERTAERLEANDPLSAMDFALRALPAPHGGARPLLAEASSALQAAKAEDRLRIVRTFGSASAQAVAFSRDQRRLSVLWDVGMLEEIDLNSGLLVRRSSLLAPLCENAPLMLGANETGEIILGLCPDLSDLYPAGALLVWDAARPEAPRLTLTPPTEIARQLPSEDRFPVSFAGTRALLYVMPGIAPVLIDFSDAPGAKFVGGGDTVQAELSAAGAHVVTLAIDEFERGRACVWDATTGRQLRCAADQNVLAIAAEPSTSRTALALREGGVVWWNVEDGSYEQFLYAAEGAATHGAFAFAEGVLARSREQGGRIVLEMLPFQRGREASILQTSAESLGALRLSPDGSLAAAAVNATGVAVWDVRPRGGRFVHALDYPESILAARVDRGEVSLVYRVDDQVRAEPAGADLAYARIIDDDATIEVTTPRGRQRFSHNLPHRFTEAVRAAATARGEQPPAADDIHPPRVNFARASADGARVLTIAERSGVCEVWAANGDLIYSSLEEVASAWRSNGVAQGWIYRGCTLSPDGTRIARSGNDGVELRDVDANRRLWSDARSLELRFSGDASRLGAFAERSGAFVINAANGAVVLANPDLPGSQMHAIAAEDSSIGVEIANGRMRLLRLRDGVELGRSNGNYFPRDGSPWPSADGRWLLSTSTRGLELHSLSVAPIEIQIAAASARVFPVAVLGPSNIERGRVDFIPRVSADDTATPCRAMLRDPLDPSRRGAAAIFPGADGDDQSAHRDSGCARPDRGANGGSNYAWALSSIVSPSDRGPGLDGNLGELGAYIINPPMGQDADAFEREIANALETASRKGRPIALLRGAQLMVGSNREHPDWDGAIARAREAARRGVAGAAWWLSEVYAQYGGSGGLVDEAMRRGAPPRAGWLRALSAQRGDPERARCWRRRAAAQGFPHAFARQAEAWERDALAHAEDAQRARESALRAIELWTRTILAARALGWPADYEHYPQARRAMLARSRWVDETSVAQALNQAVAATAAARRWGWLQRAPTCR